MTVTPTFVLAAPHPLWPRIDALLWNEETGETQVLSGEPATTPTFSRPEPGWRILATVMISPRGWVDSP